MHKIQWMCYKKGTEPFQNSNNIMSESNMMMAGSSSMVPIAESESMYVPKIEMPVMIAHNPENTESFQNDSMNIMSESNMMAGSSSMIPIAESESMYVPKIEMPVMIAHNPEGFQNNSTSIMAESTTILSGTTSMMPIAESESMYVPKIEMPVMIAHNPEEENVEKFKNSSKSRFLSNKNRSQLKPIYMMLPKKI
jgi:hypothetical protein